MKGKFYIVVFCLLSGLNSNMANADNVSQLERTLENLVTCRENRGVVLMNNKHSLSHFEKKNRWYEPKNDLKLFDGKVLRFSPLSAGMSPGVTVVVDLDFNTAKNKIQAASNIVFDRCKNNKSMQYCTKKLSKKRTIGVFRDKVSKDQWTSAIMCIYPYVR